MRHLLCVIQALAALSPQPVATNMAAGTLMAATYDDDVLAGGRDLGPYESAYNQFTGEYCNHMLLANLCAARPLRRWRGTCFDRFRARRDPVAGWQPTPYSTRHGVDCGSL